ncbi:hypothetical protein EAF04_008499 [Stromatinia cepivora]|nr:hypothetical protein EAF04_008499 [Stromatinia cepivora]
MPEGEQPPRPFIIKISERLYIDPVFPLIDNKPQHSVDITKSGIDPGKMFIGEHGRIVKHAEQLLGNTFVREVWFDDRIFLSAEPWNLDDIDHPVVIAKCQESARALTSWVRCGARQKFDRFLEETRGRWNIPAEHSQSPSEGISRSRRGKKGMSNDPHLPIGQATKEQLLYWLSRIPDSDNLDKS